MRLSVVVGVFCMFITASASSREKPAHSFLRPPILAVDETALKHLLEKCKGKVVVLNLWATWCTPCIEEFPDLLKLRATYTDKGVELIVVSIDNPKKSLVQVNSFLRRMKVDFRTYIKQTRDDEVFINSIQRNWSGAIPATFIYDRQGTLVHTLIDSQTFEQLAALVTPLLGR